MWPRWVHAGTAWCRYYPFLSQDHCGVPAAALASCRLCWFSEMWANSTVGYGLSLESEGTERRGCTGNCWSFRYRPWSWGKRVPEGDPRTKGGADAEASVPGVIAAAAAAVVVMVVAAAPTARGIASGGGGRAWRTEPRDQSEAIARRNGTMQLWLATLTRQDTRRQR